MKYLILVCAFLLAFVGTGGIGYKLGVDHMKAQELDKTALVAEAVDAANSASAEAIAKLTPKYTTINAKVQHEITEKIVYRDCSHSTAGMQLVNDALASPGSKPAGSGKLPGADAN